MEKDTSLEQVFKNFAGGHAEMDNRQFSKVAKDCGLIDKKLTMGEVDLIFTKVKGNPSIRKIKYPQFEQAISMFATKKGVKYEDVMGAIVKHGGPHYAGTKADFVKFHDDKKTYTGTHAQGGPSVVWWRWFYKNPIWDFTTLTLKLTLTEFMIFLFYYTASKEWNWAFSLVFLYKL